MNTNANIGEIVVTITAEDAAREAVTALTHSVQTALTERGICSLALSGGSSPIAAYELLARAPLDWTRVHVFWVDERAVGPDNPRSNFGAAKRALLDPARIPAQNIHRMRGEATDLAAAARDYEAVLREVLKVPADEVPRLDVVVLGVGDDGHIASLFPGEQTVHVRAPLACAVAEGKTHEARLTLTTTLLEATRESVVIVLGAGKRHALERVWSEAGSIDETPARIVRSFRGELTWIVDRSANPS